MIDFLKQLLTSDAGSFGAVFGIIGGGMWLIHWVSVQIAKIRVEHGVLTGSIDKMERNTDEIRRDISYLKGQLDVFRAGGATPPVQAHSPLAPNEIGRKIIAEMGLEEIIARNADKIMRFLDLTIGSRNPYDIQQYCIEIASVELQSFFEQQDIDRVKQYAFANGQNIFYYGSLIGVLIRDLYFTRNGIDPLSVDQHNPKQ